MVVLDVYSTKTIMATYFNDKINIINITSKWGDMIGEKIFNLGNFEYCRNCCGFWMYQL